MTFLVTATNRGTSSVAKAFVGIHRTASGLRTSQRHRRQGAARELTERKVGQN